MGWTCSLMMLMSIVVHKPAVVAAHGRRTGRITRLAPNTSEISQRAEPGCACVRANMTTTRGAVCLHSGRIRCATTETPTCDCATHAENAKASVRARVSAWSRVPIQRLAPQPLKPRVSAICSWVATTILRAPQSTLPRVPDDNLGVANPPTADRRPPTAVWRARQIREWRPQRKKRRSSDLV